MSIVLPPGYLMRKLNWFGFWRPQSMTGSCAKTYEPRFAADDTWVEVLRLGPEFQEGGLYGCWFLAARGSGIYIHTGRSLRASNRSQLADVLQLNLSSTGRQFLEWNPWRLEHNTRLCEHARSRGFDSMQLGWEGCGAYRSGPRASEACFHEIISCHPQCLEIPTPCMALRQHQGTCARTFCPRCCRTCSEHERRAFSEWNSSHWPQGPCLHNSMLRTGWDASLPCACNDSLRLLNCANSAPELEVPTDALAWTRNLRTPHVRAFLNETPLCERVRRGRDMGMRLLPKQQPFPSSRPRMTRTRKVH